MIAPSAAAEQCALVSSTTFRCWLPKSIHRANEIEAHQAYRVVESVAKDGRPQILEAPSQEAEEQRIEKREDDPDQALSVWASPKSTDDSTTAASMPTVLAPNTSVIRSGK